MTQEEKKSHAFSSEQLETVYSMIGSNEPSLFSVLQQLSKKYDEETKLQLTKEFCLQCHSDENSRVGMEFLYMNGLYTELKTLIDKNTLSTNSLNKELADIYSFMLNRRVNKEGDLLKFTKDYSFNVQDPTVECLIIFMKIYGYFQRLEYERFEEFQEELTERLLNIDNTLLRIYFQIRENELLFLFHWKKGQVKIARRYGLSILENTLNQEKKCDMLVDLGLTYLFEDYQKTMDYIKTAEEIATSYQLNYYIKGINNKVIPFVCAFHGKTEGVKTEDTAEKAHLLIKSGDIEKGISILETLENKTPFQEYYLGIATNDIDLLKRSYHRFLNEQNDYFFAQLPKHHIEKREVKL
ncbi:AimR family lysis-lysogeny pheromone receptor [Pontibacillus yanchengensis]|uniref:Prophage helix-turn-helix protein n=1 Tax=Pontibacillus yanchengensis Y32 TaxID=1385514 RepID=A0A0A2TDB8_9BACI|nr:AimR family lysis-lysogeny pheromone receptor [Pontibacillus yanchengensis]KGP72101.1 hypothetical protein N782_14030 [Pontibacillus yanchengensis Y32]